MTFFIVMFLLLMQFLWRYIDELVGKGLGIEVIGEFLMYASATLVPLAMPLAVLLSSLMTFGNMGEYYELTAIKASGISLQRVMVPVIFLVALITVGAFFFANNVLPIANLKMRTLRLDVKNLQPEVSITEGVFNKLQNYTIRVNKKDPDRHMLYDIKIYNHARRGNLDVTVADSGRMKITEDKRNMIITLWNGKNYQEEEENRRKKEKRYPHRELLFREQNIIIKMTGFEFSRSDENIFKNSYQMLNISQLEKAGDSLRRQIYKKASDFKNTIMINTLFRTDDRPVVSSPNTDVFSTIPYANPNSRTQISRKTHENARVKRVQEQKAAALRAAKGIRNDLENQEIVATDTVTDTVGIKKQTIPLMTFHHFDSLYNRFPSEEKLRFVNKANETVSNNQYLVYIVSRNLDSEGRLLRKHEIEWHRKFTLSFACLIFLFIGAPLGAIIRKGGLGLPTVISTLLFILYYIFSLIGQKIVEENILSPFLGMWASSIILVITGIFLTFQATNDSAILNIDTYLNWIREKTGLKKGILLENKSHITGKFELIEIPVSQLQTDFASVASMARYCIESLEKEWGWAKFSTTSFENTGYFYLLEFGVHYNSFIDQVILSKWFRIPYFNKRLSEFPVFNGRITSTIFTKKLYRILAVIIFPVSLIRILHLRFKVIRMRKTLRHIADLSSAMINLLNSSAIKTEAENM